VVPPSRSLPGPPPFQAAFPPFPRLFVFSGFQSSASFRLNPPRFYPTPFLLCDVHLPSDPSPAQRLTVFSSAPLGRNAHHEASAICLLPSNLPFRTLKACRPFFPKSPFFDFLRTGSGSVGFWWSLSSLSLPLPILMGLGQNSLDFLVPLPLFAKQTRF